MKTGFFTYNRSSTARQQSSSYLFSFVYEAGTDTPMSLTCTTSNDSDDSVSVRRRLNWQDFAAAVGEMVTADR